jgi:hypothetical protein
MQYHPMHYEPVLSAFNIENFGGSPPDDGEIYMANDVMTGFLMRVGDEVLQRAGISEILRQPFLPQELATAIARHLAAVKPSPALLL